MKTEGGVSPSRSLRERPCFVRAKTVRHVLQVSKQLRCDAIERYPRNVPDIATQIRIWSCKALTRNSNGELKDEN